MSKSSITNISTISKVTALKRSETHMFAILVWPMKKITITLPIAVITISLLLLVQPGILQQLVWSQPDDAITIPNATSAINPGVYPPGSAPYNLTYGQWSAKWWQWALSLPQDINPLIDQTGEHCAQGQNQTSPVWFLAGTAGGSVERTCTIPEGKAILFPVLNSVNVKTDPSETEGDLRATSKQEMDNPAILEASIDGIPLQELQNYRAESPPLFNITLPEGNIFGVPEMSSEAVSDGYWVMLQPLPVGDHNLNFQGAGRPALTGPGGLVTDVTYGLTIAPVPPVLASINATDMD